MDPTRSEAKYECLLFDLDDTLYPLSSGLILSCRKNIQDYMLHHLKIEESKVPQMCVDLYKEYGTTGAGLKALGFKFDDDEFHAYAHGRLPYETLKPDPVLKNLLLSMPQRKIVFTNADKAHAVKVLSRLGLEDCFEGIICFETLNPPTELKNEDFADSEGANDVEPKVRILCKPSVEAMEAAIKIANIDPRKTLFFDDSVRNIAAGKEAGLRTVIVGRSEHVPGADMALESIHNIKEAIPEIWEGEHQQDPNLPTAVETVVRA
ncbi:uncharacterized protein A4U43_C05F2820 [Asparagus officinalis]|uniref:Uncharacterized protein n=1 Tax=Asparagus officinalis TaxID=4686 RepID=A0A5P1EUC9_ASPOF|nr:uncharacterized protein C24B11.05 [Asparagus officinalis]ONK67700.1 uncharacterized protein A4U43_C05F2820 [Asparagus officinalis]